MRNWVPTWVHIQHRRFYWPVSRCWAPSLPTYLSMRWTKLWSQRRGNARQVCYRLLGDALSPTRSGQIEYVTKMREYLGDNAVVCPLATLFASHQAGVHQFFHMMADGRLGNPELLGEIASAHIVATLRGDMR